MTDSQKFVKAFAIGLAIFIIVIIASAIVGVINALVGFNVIDGGGSGTQEVSELSGSTYDNIRSLEIDLSSTNLEIYVGEEFKIEKYDTKDSLKVSVNGSTLKVSERARFFWNSSMGGTIVIYVPKSRVLDEVDIDIGAGKVKIEDLQAREFSLDQGAGTVEIDSSNFSKVDIDGGAGKIYITDTTLYNLDLDSGVGSVEIEGKILGKSEINAGVGSIKMRLDGAKEDYTLRIEKGIGSIKVNGEDTSGTIGSGNNYISIEGGVGSITVDFE